MDSSKYLNEIEIQQEIFQDCEDENEILHQQQQQKQLVLFDNNNKDFPPIDDVCPICFDTFTFPCRSNCGHWFCANCIMQFWAYRSSIQPCKCPLCCCLIVHLKPQTNQLVRPPDYDDDDDNVELLTKVQHYNRLYVNGVNHALYLNVIALPLLLRSISRFMLDPDGLRCIYYVIRLLGLMLALLYEKLEFEFIPTGGRGIQRSFDMCASVLMPTLFVVGVGYRWVLKFRARRFGGY